MDIDSAVNSNPVDNETLLEIIDEQDLTNLPLLEKIAKQIVRTGNNEEIRTMLQKMHFSFLSNNDNYRARALGKLESIFDNYSLDNLSALCSDSLVGNYLLLLFLIRRIPIINANTAGVILELVPKLEYQEDILSFGFMYPEEVFVEIDERLSTLSKVDIEKLSDAIVFLYQIDYLKKNKSTVEGFRQVFNLSDNAEYSLRASLISALINEDLSSFLTLIQKFGMTYEKIEDIIKNYNDVTKHLEELCLPIYFSTENIRFNGVMYNNNFSLLLYRSYNGEQKLIFPYKQVNLLEVGKVFDPQIGIFYTPKERYGRLFLRDIYSFKDIQTVETLNPDAINQVAEMDEDTIAEKIRAILEEANLTHHGPIEITDILTQNLFVNTTDDKRSAGFILKGSSFDSVHLNTIGGQILKASHSIAQIVFLVFTSRLDDQARTYFVNECDSKQKNYCIMDRNDLARLFTAYKQV